MLRWMVQGAISYLATQQDGLKEPASVLSEIAEYRGEESVLDQFVTECITITNDDKDRVAAGAIYTLYAQWSRDRGCQPTSSIVLGRTLIKRNQWRTTRSDGTFHVGIKLRVVDI